MSRLKKTIEFETTTDIYVADEILGEGGAGRVYGARSQDGEDVAIKVLINQTLDKRKRFKNELSFLSKNVHARIVSAKDHGMVTINGKPGPFYVMRRYESNLRRLMTDGISSDKVLSYFSQILDGVEAAHLKGVVHRDLKPENVLVNRSGELAIADFGVALFTELELATLVATMPRQRLANFKYAAPEQMKEGSPISPAADIYALGLMLNEMFTSEIPHGTNYPKIRSFDESLEFLDRIVEEMISNNSSSRPQSIQEVKTRIQQYRQEAVALQKLNALSREVVPDNELDNPLAFNPPRIISFDFERGTLSLTFDRDIDEDWVGEFRNLGNYTAVHGAGPRDFQLRKRGASVQAQERDLQRIIDNFKEWLPGVSRALELTLRKRKALQERERKHELDLAREEEEKRLRVLRTVKL